MDKNRTMAIKHTMAKKWAMKEVLDNSKLEMCCKTIPNKIPSVYKTDYKPYSDTNSFFYSKYAIQKRIDALVGKHYPAQEFIKDYSNIYEYLIMHTVPEARQYFSQTEISLIQLKLLEKGG